VSLPFSGVFQEDTSFAHNKKDDSHAQQDSEMKQKKTEPGSEA
jgi:hypothetical protein